MPYYSSIHLAFRRNGNMLVLDQRFYISSAMGNRIYKFDIAE